MTRILSALTLLLAFASCNKDEGDDFRFRLNETTAIQSGDVARLFDIDFKVELLNVEDSRCPEGAVCVWEGEALTKFKVKTLKTDTTVVLSSHPDRVDSALIDSYILRLESVNPYPKVDEPLDLKDYTVRSVLNKAN